MCPQAAARQHHGRTLGDGLLMAANPIAANAAKKPSLSRENKMLYIEDNESQAQSDGEAGSYDECVAHSADG